MDISVFVVFFLIVISVSMYKSRRKKTSGDFFLASRDFVWPLIGFSLIAANISTEHFVGMSGQGVGVMGIAVASYKCTAAIAGTVINTLSSLLNSLAAVLTIDPYKRHIEKDASSAALVRIGRYLTAIFVLIVCLIAPYLGSPKFKGIFDCIWQGWA